MDELNNKLKSLSFVDNKTKIEYKKGIYKYNKVLNSKEEKRLKNSLEKGNQSGDTLSEVRAFLDNIYSSIEALKIRNSILYIIAGNILKITLNRKEDSPKTLVPLDLTDPKSLNFLNVLSIETEYLEVYNFTVVPRDYEGFDIFILDPLNRNTITHERAHTKKTYDIKDWLVKTISKHLETLKKEDPVAYSSKIDEINQIIEESTKMDRRQKKN